MTRSPLLLAAVGAALALGACAGSGDGGSGNGQSQNDAAFDGALRYARCMRDHGVDMPDPQRVGTGGIKITAKGGPGGNAKMQVAQKDCQTYLRAGGGRAPSAAERAKAQAAMLAYAKCMRAQGVDMPDPKFSSGGGFTFELGGPGRQGGTSGDGPNPDSPAFKAADTVCHAKLAAIEKGGPGDGGPSTQEKAQ